MLRAPQLWLSSWEEAWWEGVEEPPSWIEAPPRCLSGNLCTGEAPAEGLPQRRASGPNQQPAALSGSFVLSRGRAYRHCGPDGEPRLQAPPPFPVFPGHVEGPG